MAQIIVRRDQLVQTDHLHLKRLIPSPDRDSHAHRIDPRPDQYFDTLLGVVATQKQQQFADRYPAAA